jgi:TonB family protein
MMMKSALAWSLVMHLAVVLGAAIASQRLEGSRLPAEFIDVSLVTMPVQRTVASVAPPAPKEPAPAPIARPGEAPDVESASLIPDAPPPSSERVVPDVAEKPKEKPKPKPKPEPKKAPPREEKTEEPPRPSIRQSPVKEEESARQAQEAEGEGKAAQTGSGGEGTGSGIGEVRLDSENFRFSYYLSALRNKIAAHWAPAALEAGTVSRTAVIRFQIEKSGRLSEVKVETSSGNVFFDQAALRAVLAASPLAPLPREFGESTLGVHFEFVQTP